MACMGRSTASILTVSRTISAVVSGVNLTMT